MKIYRFLISPLFMGILFIVFAISMAVATFIENDFGSAVAYSTVYNTRWFELILLLLVLNLVGQILEFKLYRRGKLTIFMFHSAFVVMILGAGITRYTGYEGTIHIREGEAESLCYSGEDYIGYSVRDNNGNVLAEKQTRYLLSSDNSKNYREEFSAGGSDYEIVLAQVLTNAMETIAETAGGSPLISLYVNTAAGGMTNYILQEGESIEAAGVSIGFKMPGSQGVQIGTDIEGFFISSPYEIAEIDMMQGDSTIFEGGSVIRLRTMQILGVGGIRIIPQQLSMSGIKKAVAADPAERKTGKTALTFHLFSGEKPLTVTLWNDDSKSQCSSVVQMNGNSIELNYGSMVTRLPFEIKLNDFILERYPGSNSPSGYKSDVVLYDKEAGVEKPFVIFMNNILKYKGYRFYQSSFDQDERGTILSVNRDRTGMLVTYTGYSLMILFIILSIFNKDSVFRTITTGYWSSPFRKAATVITLLLLSASANNLLAQKLVPDKKAAEEFGKILVQDQKGRTKPLFTMSSDILRKVARENEYDGLSPMQVYLGFYLDFEHWQNEPLIKISNADLARKLGIRGDRAAFTDIVDFSNGGTYKLSEDIQEAYSKAPGQRNKSDKEIMKVDERINILYMIYTGEFARFFPLKDNSHQWGNYEAAVAVAKSREDSLYLQSVIPMFAESLRSNNKANAIKIAQSVNDYQQRFSEYDLPAKGRINAEVFYYKAKIFERLFPFYATVGLIMLIVLIVNVILGKKENSLVRILGYHVFIGFIFHTVGLALRWYISGHSPMSNGYESMLFISWVTLLAGFIFSRKSPFTLSATAVLGAMTLMVAHLSFMDPEITNLVPVLKSYWLTLHVSVITGSYGFLGLGALLGLINMILLALSNPGNIDRIGKTIGELTVINYKTLTLGLYLLTIGTFLGAVWANESWGRYWGWDPKETWSLITIIIYSIVVHSRLIPGLKDIYSFNILSLFAFSSVLMTYFGVNYYLSGLHSYAGGDPVPVPSFVYIAVISLAAVSLLAYLRYSKIGDPRGE